MKNTSLRDICILTLVIGFIALTLAPVVARLDRESEEAKCQSNLARIGEAMSLYVADNSGRYPTNRPYTSMGKLGNISQVVRLSPTEIDPATQQPMRFAYGITWVEALYPYVWKSAAKTDQDWRSLWRCPSSSGTADTDYNNLVGYVFNACLVEYWSGVVRNPQKLMMAREFGRLTSSTLRPSNPEAISGSTYPPMYAFLNNRDGMTDTSAVCTPHTGGSYILCADGHVKHFTLGYYPEFNISYTASRAWDMTTQQWYNYNQNPVHPLEKRCTIAVTP